MAIILAYLAFSVKFPSFQQLRIHPAHFDNDQPLTSWPCPACPHSTAKIGPLMKLLTLPTSQWPPTHPAWNIFIIFLRFWSKSVNPFRTVWTIASTKLRGPRRRPECVTKMRRRWPWLPSLQSRSTNTSTSTSLRHLRTVQSSSLSLLQRSSVWTLMNSIDLDKLFLETTKILFY